MIVSDTGETPIPEPRGNVDNVAAVEKQRLPVIRGNVKGLVNSLVGAAKGVRTNDKNGAEGKGQSQGSSDSGEFVFDIEEPSTRHLEMPELSEIEPIPLVTDVRDYLNSSKCQEEHGERFALQTPALLDNSEMLCIRRRKNDVIKRGLAFFVQRIIGSAEVKDGKSYYDLIFPLGLYDSYGILLENMARLFFLDEYMDKCNEDKKSAFLFAVLMLLSRMEMGENGQYRVVTKKSSDDYKGLFLECAAGTCDIAARLNEAFTRFRLHMMIEQDQVDRPHIGRLRKQASVDARRISVDIEGLPKSTRRYRRIGALDNFSGFSDVAKSKNVAGIEANLCLPTKEFFEKTGLKPNSIDTLTLVLAIDRLPNLEQALINICCLCKMDGSSKVMIGFYLPMNNVADSNSKNPDVRKIEFFDAQCDVRQRWMEGNGNLLFVKPEEFGDSDNEQQMEAAMLADFILYLKKRFGLEAISIGSQPCEVYSPHCVSEFARDLRKKYKKDELLCGVPEIDDVIYSVYAKNSAYKDDDMVVLPERIPRLYTPVFRCVKPLDGYIIMNN